MKNKDLTVGEPSKLLWAYSMPMFLSVVFQQVYNIADSVIAGKYAGTDALAAVGASYPITMIFMAVAIGANVGSSVVISQLFGQKNMEKMKTAIRTALIFVMFVGTVLTAAGYFFCDDMIRLLNTPADIFADSSLYLRIYVFGLLFLFLYNICNGIFTALGDSKTPLYLLIGSSILNILLDFIFVKYLHMAVAGVAWATFIAQGISSLLAFFLLFIRLRSIKTEERGQVFSVAMLKKICSLAIPSILQQSFVSVGNLFIQNLVNGFGSDVVAGYSAAVKLNTFMITSFSTLGNAVSGFSAQNMGAGKLKRITKGWRAGLLMAFLISVPFIVVYFFFGSSAIGMFVDSGEKSEAVIATGVRFLRIVSPFYLVVSTKLISDGVLRGCAAVGEFMATTFLDLILRVVLAFWLAGILGAVGIWLSWPVGWLLSAGLSLYFYKSGRWKKAV